MVKIEIITKNLMEVMVRNALRECKSSLNGCTCEQCLEDIVALSLNQLPPRYVVTKKGELLSKVSMLENQFHVDIISHIVKNNEIVQKNPRH